jgi:hypothetical protein
MLASAPAVAETDAAVQPAPTRDECLAAHQSAQDLKRKGSLLEAEAQLEICSSVGCPGAIISDCGQWIADLEQRTPSMVFEVRLDQKQVSEYRIEVDGAAVTDPSKAFKVNPGRHVVRVELPNFEPQEETLVLPEGQRMRLVSFAFTSQPPVAAAPTDAAIAPVPPPPYAPSEESRPTPVIVYPLLGLAAAGFGAFGVFSFVGKAKQKDLEDGCSPDCSDEDLEPMKRAYLIGDISAGVGVAALVTAGIFYFNRPARSTTGSALSVRIGSVSAREPSSLSISLGRRW